MGKLKFDFLIVSCKIKFRLILQAFGLASALAKVKNGRIKNGNNTNFIRMIYRVKAYVQTLVLWWYSVFSPPITVTD